MRNNMITKKLIKFALLFFLIGLTACDNKLTLLKEHPRV